MRARRALRTRAALLRSTLTRAAPRSFNVYVTQPEVKPGCVLRRSNWSVLEGRKLVDDTEARLRLLSLLKCCLRVA